MSRFTTLLCFSLVIILICLIDHSFGQSRSNKRDKTGDMDKAMLTLKIMQKKSVGTPDPHVGEMVEQMLPDDQRNADEMGTYMEGDILLSSDYRSQTYPRWPGGVVPFVIEGRFNDQQLGFIREAMNSIEEQTCVKFERASRTQRDYVAIKGGNTGCWSALGRNGGRQELNLQPSGCLNSPGITTHELLHALGLPHEHTRQDRDNYVSIAFRNIENEHIHNFERVKYVGFGVPYDFNSIMHYSTHAFSRNYRQTIFPKDDVQIGQRRGLSELDVKEINRLYPCNTAKPATEGPDSVGYRQVEKKPEFTLEEIFKFWKYNPNTGKWSLKNK